MDKEPEQFISSYTLSWFASGSFRDILKKCKQDGFYIEWIEIRHWMQKEFRVKTTWTVHKALKKMIDEYNKDFDRAFN